MITCAPFILYMDPVPVFGRKKTSCLSVLTLLPGVVRPFIYPPLINIIHALNVDALKSGVGLVELAIVYGNR